mgnify:CR=1 FL=1
MPSFDVVSEIDMQELRNAVDQASREISSRFDFKGTDTAITRDDTLIEIRSSTEDRLKGGWKWTLAPYRRPDLSGWVWRSGTCVGWSSMVGSRSRGRHAWEWRLRPNRRADPR